MGKLNIIIVSAKADQILLIQSTPYFRRANNEQSQPCN